MLIIWGTKRVTKRLGYVADFCPLCRDVRTFEVVRVGMAGHLYYITLSDGELAGYERTCSVCRTALNAQPERYAQMYELLLPPNELQPLTFPKLKEYWAARIAIERELKSVLGKVGAEDRQALLREPFVLLSPGIETRYASSLAFDRITGITLAIAVAACFIVPPIAGGLSPDSGNAALGLLFLGGFIAVLVQMFLARGRFVRNQIVPLLASALRPLKPTAAELDAVLQEMNKLGRRIGSKLTAAQVMDALAGPQATVSSQPSAVRS